MLRISGSSGPRSTCSSSEPTILEPCYFRFMLKDSWITKAKHALAPDDFVKMSKKYVFRTIISTFDAPFTLFSCILLIWRIKARRILLFLFVCMSCFSRDHLRNCFNDCEIFHQSRRSRLKTCRNVICKNDKIPTSQRPNSKKKKQHEHALKYEHFSKVSKRFIAKLNFRLNGS